METIKRADLNRKQEDKMETFMVWVYEKAAETGELFKKIDDFDSPTGRHTLKRAIVKDFFDVYFTQIPDFAPKALQRRIAYNCDALARGKGMEKGYDHFVETMKNLEYSNEELDNFFEDDYFVRKGWIK